MNKRLQIIVAFATDCTTASSERIANGKNGGNGLQQRGFRDFFGANPGWSCFRNSDGQWSSGKKLIEHSVIFDSGDSGIESLKFD